LEEGLSVISSSLVNLTSLSLSNSPKELKRDLDSLSKLTNLEKIKFLNIDVAVMNYSTLIKMKSIVVSSCHHLSGLGLSYLVANKQFLVQLKIGFCDGISSEGYHCLTTLTNLTHLSAINSKLDDIGLNMICSSCLLIEDLDIRHNGLITIEGLNNIHCLTHLKSLFSLMIVMIG
jgi:Leucine-rich repeat (LRR) protein